MKKIASTQAFYQFKKAIKDYEMIKEGDHLAIGVSGGKDSMVLLFLLNLLKRQGPVQFDLTAITLDLGQGANWLALKNYCQQATIDFHLEKTQISEIVFEVRQEKNPCSLCAKLRKGALHQAALRLGCNKVALGHHLDDVAETFLMNLLFAGKLGSFLPAIFLNRVGLTLIRPMVYLPQQVVLSIANNKKFPVVENPCPASKATQRQKMRQLVNQLSLDYPQFRERLLTALQNIDFNNLWKQRHSLEKNYSDLGVFQDDFRF
ncbi:MAG: ATP-binding protein [Bacillota bacterium]